jgi:hypothetical protein
VVFKHARLVTMMSGVGPTSAHRLPADGDYLDALALRLAEIAAIPLALAVKRVMTLAISATLEVH